MVECVGLGHLKPIQIKGPINKSWLQFIFATKVTTKSHHREIFEGALFLSKNF